MTSTKLYIMLVLMVACIMLSGQAVSSINERSVDGNKILQMGQCDMLNQIQAVVIQMLTSHTEYGKGIHRLHGLMAQLQRDSSQMKSKISNLERYQPRIKSYLNESLFLNRSIQEVRDLIDHHIKHAHRHPRHQLTSSPEMPQPLAVATYRLEVEKAVRNLTGTLTYHGSRITELERKYKNIRRTANKVAKTMGSWQASHGDGSNNEKKLLQHFMEKQKEINANIQKTIRYLADNLGKIQRPQADAPYTNEQPSDCPEGFVRQLMSCYRFVNITATWVDAEKHCQSLNHHSHLVSIETRSEADYLVDFRTHNDAHWCSAYVWTGGHDMSTEGSWSWVGTGRSLTFKNWRPGEPNNHNQEQHCIYFRADGKDSRWDDWHCHGARLNFVCEIILKA